MVFRYFSASRRTLGVRRGTAPQPPGPANPDGHRRAGHRSPAAQVSRIAITLLCAWAALSGTTAVAADNGQREHTDLLTQVLNTACEAHPAAADKVFADIPEVSSESELPLQGPGHGWSRQLQLGDSGRIKVVARNVGGRLRHVAVTHDQIVADTVRPQTFIAAGPNCRIRTARRLAYDDAGNAQQVEMLDGELRPTGRSEPLNPPVPEGVDSDGVAVAMVDAGVDYRLPEIATRLARDDDGRALGFDFWDLDERPFDANPARSAFFAQRHGTRTASLLLREAPVARLIPYRYPRPDMSRMTDVVQHAIEHGVRIVNISMGSGRYEDWQAFETAARAAPGILFIVSAGNDGRDIDQRPVYPAALTLPNLITVTSAEDSGELAKGSNWGADAVDLLVPGERQLVTGFNGQIRIVSGSSYAVVRVSALAACLLAEDPAMDTSDLKDAVLARAIRGEDETRHVAIGFLPDPVTRQRGLCPPQQAHIEVTERYVFAPQITAADGAGLTHVLRPAAAIMAHTDWDRAAVQAALDTAAQILQQCGIHTPEVTMHRVDGPQRYRYYLQDQAVEMMRGSDFARPTLVFLHDTLERVQYDAVSFGRGNSRRRPELADTVWITRQLPHPGVGLAHELAHVLMNSGQHTDDPGNLMYERTSEDNRMLTAEQCARMISAGEAHGLLQRLSTADSAQRQ